MANLKSDKERMAYGGLFHCKFYNEKHKYVITNTETKEDLFPVGASTISKYADQIGAGLAASAAYITKYGGDYRKEWKKAAEKGTEVHAWIEAYVESKEKPAIPDDEETKSAINGFLAWEEKHKPKFSTQELLVYSKEYNIAGLVDQAGVTFPAEDHKIKHVLDYKTNKVSALSMAIQTEWYRRLMLEEYPQAELGDNIVLQLMKKPDYRSPTDASMRRYVSDKNTDNGYIEYRIGDHDDIWDGCKACLTVYRLNKRK